MKKLLSALLCTVMVLSALPICAFAQDSSADAEYVEGEVIITSEKEIKEKLAGVEELEELETYSEDENVYVAEINGDVEKICKKLNKIDEITAEPNYVYHTDSFTMPAEVTKGTDTYKNYQKWYLDDTMHITDTWKTENVTGEGVTVAIIDNGFYLGSVDAPKKLWKNSKGTAGWNVLDNNDDISPIYKKDGTSFQNSNHGSNIAGIIAMAADGVGGIGAAYGSELMLLKAATYVNENDEPVLTTAAIVSAIDFARENGADIINMSFSTTEEDSAMAKAVKRADSEGILLVASAGNKSAAPETSKSFPAAFPEVIGVMASDKTADGSFKLADFSNYNSKNIKCYDIVAPGVQIVGCNDAPTGHVVKSGTSQATALVSASAALYMEKYPNRSISELKADLIGSAAEVSDSNGTFKKLDTLKFMEYSKPADTNGKVKGVSVSDLTLNYKGTAKINPTVQADKGVKYTLTYESKDSRVATVDGNGNVKGTKSWLKKSTTIVCTATDEFGNVAQTECKVTVGYAWWQWIIGTVLFGFLWY